MKHLYSIIILLLSVINVYSQSNSKLISIAKNNIPEGLLFSDEFNEHTISISDWGDIVSTGFYKTTESEEAGDVLGYLITPNNKHILIDTFEVEGGQAHIAAIFLANADKDKERELIILIKWNIRHYQIDGTLFETRVYDNIYIHNMPQKLTYLKSISKKLSGGFDGWNEGKETVSKYKTASSIKQRLKQLGY